MLLGAETYQNPAWMQELHPSENAWLKLFEKEEKQKIKPTKIYLEPLGQPLQ